MKCPRTHQKLKAITINNIEVNLSTGCGGVWFDRFELEKFDEIHEEAGTLLIEHMKNFHRLLPDASARLKCPKDPDVVITARNTRLKLMNAHSVKESGWMRKNSQE